MDLSVVIVNYETFELTKNTVNSILEYSYPFSVEVIIVDNASSDDSLSKLQDYFATVLAAADVDAFVFDSFSNPTPQMIRERLFPFIEKIQASHPGKPLIFQQTIFRESRAFSTSIDAAEARKMEVADSMMKIACKKYKDVYFIKPDAVPDDHSASIDGTHPSNYGYQLWAESIVKPVTKILRKYGIK